LSGRYACYQVYETKDGRYLSLGALEPKFWENACRTLGREDLIPLQFAGSAQAECMATLREIFRTRAAAEWLAVFESVDTCLALVNDLAEMIEDPQVLHRGLIAEVEHPTEGKLKQMAPTVRLTATPGAIKSPPPQLGEHTRQVLLEIGYSDEAIAQLARDGAIGLLK
jgi:crotonobetainyl-CoA:carnitine CoA-transferase CaiB-like acyl-CoA transferase